MFIYSTAVVYKSTILSFPPPTCIAHPGAILLHDYWTVYDSLFDLPSVCYTSYISGNIIISFKGQTTTLVPPQAREPTWAIGLTRKILNLDICWPILWITLRESKGIQGVYQWRSPNESRIHWNQAVTMNTDSGMAREAGTRTLSPGSLHVYISIYIYISIYLYLFIYLYIYISISISISLYQYLYLYLYLYVYTYIYIYVYIYIYTYMYIYTLVPTQAREAGTRTLSRVNPNPRGLPVALAKWILDSLKPRGDNEYRIRDCPRRRARRARTRSARPRFMCIYLYTDTYISIYIYLYLYIYIYIFIFISISISISICIYIYIYISIYLYIYIYVYIYPRPHAGTWGGNAYAEPGKP